MPVDPTKLEDRLDRVKAGSTEVQMQLGGVQFVDMAQVMEFAKLMALGGEVVPPHLRNEPGACLGILTKALRFGFDPFSLAEHSYITRKKNMQTGEEIGTIAYDSFVIHAIIEAHGGLDKPLECAYEGEGEERRCIVTGYINGEKKVHRGPTLGEIKKNIGTNSYGKLKGSPLWISKPDQQLWYDGRRDWCRAFRPAILLGVYDKDEFDESSQHRGPDNAKDVTPQSHRPRIGQRDQRSGETRRGFSREHVDRETRTGGPAAAQAADTGKASDADKATLVPSEDQGQATADQTTDAKDQVAVESKSIDAEANTETADGETAAEEANENDETAAAAEDAAEDRADDDGQQQLGLDSPAIAAGAEAGGPGDAPQPASNPLLEKQHQALSAVIDGGKKELLKAAQAYWKSTGGPIPKDLTARAEQIYKLHADRVTGTITAEACEKQAAEIIKG